MHEASEDKKARSEAKRLEALYAKRELEQQRAAVIAQSLKDVDSAPKSKKIVFDSDSEGETETAPAKQESGIVQIASKSKKSSKRPALFDSDDEGDEEEITLNIENRHTGKKGEKLMKLEARFGHDERFKMNDKFASDDEEDEAEDEEQDEISLERRQQKHILAKVLGKALKSTDEKKSNAPMARPFTRFDPLNEEHIKWMQMYGNKGKEKQEKKAQEEEKKLEEAQDRTVEGHFFEMDTGFAEQLQKAAQEESAEPAGGFSFLAMMGRKNVPSQEPEKSARVEEDIVEDKKLNKMLNKDREEEPGPETLITQKARITNEVQPFFLTGDEPFVRSVVSNFRRTQSMEKIINNWASYRESIIKVFHHQKRNARRNIKERGLKYNYGPKKAF